MDVAIEDYALKGPVVDEADRIIAAVHREIHEQWAFELGFQVARTASVEGATQFYGEPMLTAEYNTWRAFLPNSYSHKAGRWSQCDPKLVPAEVMEKARIAHSRRVFDDLQIWSAAPEDIDPMLVGVVKVKGGWQHFKIARWGESLASLEAITQVVKDRRHYVKTFLRRRVFLWTLAVAIAATIVSIVVSGSAPLMIAFGVLMIVMGDFYVIQGVDMTKQLERRAIRRYRPELPANLAPAA